MERIDRIVKHVPAAQRDKALDELKGEIDSLSESTVCEKNELKWPHGANWRHVVAVVALWVRESVAHLFGRTPKSRRPAYDNPRQPDGRAARAGGPGRRAGRGGRRARPRHLRGHRQSLRPVQPALEPRHRPLVAPAHRAGRASHVPSPACSTCAPGPATSPSPSRSKAGPPRSSAPTSLPRCSRSRERRSRASGSLSPTCLTFELADAQSLPFPDESFDVVTVAFGVRNLPNRANELRRGAPGAQARRAVRDLRVLAPHVPALAVGLPRLPAVRRSPPSAVCSPATARLSSTSTTRSGRFPRQPALAAELRAAGFPAVSWTNLTGGIVALHVAVK